MKNCSVICFTRNGGKTAKAVSDVLLDNDRKVTTYIVEKYNDFNFAVFDKLSEVMKACAKSDEIVFVGACGIAVRAISPYVNDKTTDFAVVVVDEKARFAISLLSGHIGGANSLTKIISDGISSTPVITTASDINNKFAVDVWAKNNKLCISDIKLAKTVSADILDNKKVGLYSDFEIYGNMPTCFENKVNNTDVVMAVTNKKKLPYNNVLRLIPKNLSVGIGCRKNTDFEKLFGFILDIFEENNLDINAIKELSSINLKRNEFAITEAAKMLNVPYVTYSSENMLSLEGEFGFSQFVKNITGVDCVCERSAMLASCNGELLIRKTLGKGMTISVAVSKPLIYWEE